MNHRYNTSSPKEIFKASLICLGLQIATLQAYAEEQPESVTPTAPELQDPNHCFCVGSNPDPTYSWTAFKFTDKTGVSGTFDDLQVNFARSAASITDLFASGSFSAATTAVNSGNPARDETLKQHFFKHFASTRIEGKVVNATEHMLLVEITMNGKQRKVPFKVQWSDDNDFARRNFKAVATINMLHFNLGAAHESIHKACEALHTGPDGISKTWTSVDLSINGSIKDDCSCESTPMK